MSNLFGVNVAALVAKTLAPITFDQILVKIATIEDPADSTSQIKVGVPYLCKGFIDNYDNTKWNKTNIHSNGTRIVILANTLPVGIAPRPGDNITAEGVLYTIIEDGVIRDAHAATYECHSEAGGSDVVIQLPVPNPLLEDTLLAPTTEMGDFS